MESKQQDIKHKEGTTQQEVDWNIAFEDLQDQNGKMPSYTEDLIDVIEQSFSPFPTLIQSDSLFVFFNNIRNQTQNIQYIQAPGGSGKTLCFVIPIVVTVLDYFAQNQSATFQQQLQLTKMVRGKQDVIDYTLYEPLVVITADTKLLVEQTKLELQRCIPESFKEQLKITTLVGGETIYEFNPILISTPAKLRLMQKLEGHQNPIQIGFNKVQLFVSDEAESLWEQFTTDFNEIVVQVRNNKQINCIFASATLTKKFKEQISDIYFEQKVNPDKFHDTVIKIDLKGVSQYSYQLSNSLDSIDTQMEFIFKEISQILREIYVGKDSQSQVIIFLNEVQYIEKLYEILKSQDKIGSTLGKIHNRLGQMQQQSLSITDKNRLIKETYNRFRQDEFKILISSDIMAKGIDIDGVSLVINVGVPRINSKDQNSSINPQVYLHRIARTGRYIRKGISLTYYLPDGQSSKYNIKDKQLENEVKKVENLNENEIKDLSSNQNYIEFINEKQLEALLYNKNNFEENKNNTDTKQ
ncbi:P-loop containing nucleoside triphosphate hydrolase [Pseudocohnilembus persalinus]|uniref:ATP-dependent RNA helicase n=1 Tax=Pseudocohnilembus persalinus TaxID=266149 RepID=A0A0V0R3M3_PSEPJ|nr:P-loop containing nucleoside triphosphate hydrolase [Pseudocohnilembus persalinus]|eukprot:KRX09089.1 P-loop containing nucleoside triphosphate hydrolase [Pseudocohnilembus persalinus]